MKQNSKMYMRVALPNIIQPSTSTGIIEKSFPEYECDQLSKLKIYRYENKNPGMCDPDHADLINVMKST